MPRPVPDASTARFRQQAARALPVLQWTDGQTMRQRDLERQRLMRDLPQAVRLRELATRLRDHTLAELDRYIALAREQVEANGGTLCVAEGAAALTALVQRRVADATVIAVPALVGALGLPGGRVTPAEAVFIVAETGQSCVIAEASIGSGPLIVVAGIESIVPRLADLAVFLKLFARSGTGRVMPPRVQLCGHDRLGKFHVVLLDGGRRALLDGPHRELLRCIGCGACANACPVYRQPTDDAVRAPISAVVHPLLAGLAGTDELPFASTLCGACASACPVNIDLPTHLLSLRATAVERGHATLERRMSVRLWAWTAGSSLRYRWVTRWQRWRLRRRGRDGWIAGSRGAGSQWFAGRDLPVPAVTSFHELRQHRQRRGPP